MVKNYLNHKFTNILREKVDASEDADYLISLYFYLSYLISLIDYGFLDFDKASNIIIFDNNKIKQLNPGFEKLYEKIMDFMWAYEENKKNETGSSIENARKDLEEIKKILKLMKSLVNLQYKDSEWFINSL